VKDPVVRLAVALLAAGLFVVGCSQAAPAPTQAPASQPKAAEPTKAPAAAPAATKAPAAQPTAAPAASWPQKGKAIQIIVPMAAGGPQDMAARVLAAPLEKELGTPVEVVNKPGAGNQIGMGEVVRSKPDGYTLGTCLFPTGIVSYNDPNTPATYGRKDMQPIAMFSSDTYLIVSLAKGPYKTIKDLIDAAKAKPETIKLATAGITSGPTMIGNLITAATGAKFAYVHFDGGSQMMTALLGEHVDTTAPNGSVAYPSYKSGDTAALAMVTKDESPFFPGVKPLTAQGINVSVVAAHGIWGPVGIPKDVMATISAAIKRAVARDDVKAQLEKMTLSAKYMDTPEYTAAWDEVEAQVKAAFGTPNK